MSCIITDTHTRCASLAIPTEPNGGNHTPAFTASAATPEAHEVSLVIMKALAHTGFRVIDDDAFFGKVRAWACQRWSGGYACWLTLGMCVVHLC